MTDEISTLLDAYHSGALWEMARVAQLSATGSKRLKKNELLALMRREFFSQRRVQASLKRLGEVERAALNRLQLHGGEISTRAFKRELVRAGLATEAPPAARDKYGYHRSTYVYGRAADHEGSPHNARSKIFEDIMARLTYHGLVFSQGAAYNTGGTAYKLQFHPGDTLYIPQVIRRFLPKPEPVALGVPEWRPDRVERSDPNLLLRDLYLYWDFVRRNQVSLIQAGTVGKRHLKAINDMLLAPDPRLDDARREDETYRLFLLRLLLQSLNLLQAQGGELHPAGKNAARIPDFWRQPLPQQLRACLVAWKDFHQLAELPGDVAQFGPQYARARQTVLDSLKSIPPDRWIEPEDLLEQALAKNLGFLFPDHSRIEEEKWHGRFYIGGYYYGDRTELLQKMEAYERQFIESCIGGFCYQVGMVELGYAAGTAGAGTAHAETAEAGTAQDGSRKWGAVRLTSLGQAILGLMAETVEEGEPGKLVVQPNFHLLAIGPVPLEWLAQLDLFARREKADRGVVEYQLARDSVYGAQQLGLSVKEISDFLTEMSGMALPQNVQRSLEEWGAHHERIVFRTDVSLLQAADAGLLAALTANAETGKSLARALTPDVAIIRKGKEKALISALLGQSLLPAVSGANPEAADHSVIVQADGTIQPIHAVPSLHLRGRVERLAESLPDGRWRLTRQSVGHAGGSKNKVQQLLAELGKLHRGALPGDLVAQVKAWGGYYGNAAVETLTLIEFRDQETLKEVAQQPELRDYLTLFPTHDRALAIVPAERLEQVKAILAQLGVPVKGGLRR